MKLYKNIHTGNIKTKIEWLIQFNKQMEYGDLEATETFEQFINNGDLEEVLK